MSVANLLGLFDLIVVGSVSAIVTGLLWWLSRQEPSYAVLRHVRVVMLVVTANVLVFGAVFVINDYFPWLFKGETSKYITRTAIALLLIPSVGWLLYYLPRLLLGNRNGNGRS